MSYLLFFYRKPSKLWWPYRAANQRGPRAYEFPSGYNYYFTGAERYLVGEQFFTHSPQLIVCYSFSYFASLVLYLSGTQASNPNLPKTIPALISSSLGACDSDLRGVLVSNVVLAGGGSLFHGFADRLANELARILPHVRPLCLGVVCAYEMVLKRWSPFLLCRPRFMPRVTRRNEGTEDGLVGASSPVSVHSINYGSARKSGRYVPPSSVLHARLMSYAWVPGTRKSDRGPALQVITKVQ